MKKVAVIPAFNEESRISGALLGILPYVDSLVVVDDGSSDETFLHAKAPGKIHVIRHAINRGQGAALRTGTEGRSITRCRWSYSY